MHAMTKANLEAAFAGESQAHMKYLIFADVAEKAGFPEAARLFRAIAHAERVHATNHLKQLGLIGKTNENLVAAFSGEQFEVAEMYPAFSAVAKLQEEKGSIRSFHYAIEAEKIHDVMFKKAHESILAGNDIEAAHVYICPICGHTHIGEAPDKCPICGAVKSKYLEF